MLSSVFLCHTHGEREQRAGAPGERLGRRLVAPLVGRPRPAPAGLSLPGGQPRVAGGSGSPAGSAHRLPPCHPRVPGPARRGDGGKGSGSMRCHQPPQDVPRLRDRGRAVVRGGRWMGRNVPVPRGDCHRTLRSAPEGKSSFELKRKRVLTMIILQSWRWHHGTENRMPLTCVLFCVNDRFCFS